MRPNAANRSNGSTPRPPAPILRRPAGRLWQAGPRYSDGILSLGTGRPRLGSGDLRVPSDGRCSDLRLRPFPPPRLPRAEEGEGNQFGLHRPVRLDRPLERGVAKAAEAVARSDPAQGHHRHIVAPRDTAE